MSKVKNPDEKKLLSLKLDGRNSFGHSPIASRKNIPRAKRRSSKAARGKIAEILQKQNGPSAQLEIETAESLIRSQTIESQRKRFKKVPDAPLVSTLLQKKKREPVRLPEIGIDISLLEVVRMRKRLKSKPTD
jgi:hypothetical protein